MEMLSNYDHVRYGRQMLLGGWGEEGQAKLKSSSVFVAGAGGLGSPVSLYLAAAGVGAFLLWATVLPSERIPVKGVAATVGRVESTVTNTKAGTVRARRRAQLSSQVGGRVVDITRR